MSTSDKTRDLARRALELDPSQRFALAETILRSLDEPDPSIDAIWLEEAAHRLDAYRKGLVTGVPAEDVVGKF